MYKFYKISTDGTVARGSGTVVPDGFTEDFSLIQLDSDGNLYEFYNQDGTPDTDKIQKYLDEENLKIAKEVKTKALEELVITHNTVAYDANGRAIGNMSAVMGVANFKYNQMVASDALPSDAYNFVYKDTKIWWKGADNQPHEVMIESVCEALQKSMTEVSNILGL